MITTSGIANLKVGDVLKENVGHTSHYYSILKTGQRSRAFSYECLIIASPNYPQIAGEMITLTKGYITSRAQDFESL